MAINGRARESLNISMNLVLPSQLESKVQFCCWSFKLGFGADCGETEIISSAASGQGEYYEYK